MKCQLFSAVVFFIVGHLYCANIDQSQSGDLNVQVDLKDLQIIALLKGGKEEYVDYDYAYDYNEMTIKPQNRTTPRPLNGTSVTEPDTGTSKSTTVPVQNAITEIPSKAPITELSDVTTDMTVIDYITTVKNTAQVSTVPFLSDNKNATVTSNFTNNSSKCKKGFVLNYKGDCELRLQGTGNALLKLVKLSQKLKLRRENNNQD